MGRWAGAKEPGIGTGDLPRKGLPQPGTKIQSCPITSNLLAQRTKMVPFPRAFCDALGDILRSALTWLWAVLGMTACLILPKPQTSQRQPGLQSDEKQKQDCTPLQWAECFPFFQIWVYTKYGILPNTLCWKRGLESTTCGKKLSLPPGIINTTSLALSHCTCLHVSICFPALTLRWVFMEDRSGWQKV